MRAVSKPGCRVAAALALCCTLAQGADIAAVPACDQAGKSAVPGRSGTATAALPAFAQASATPWRAGELAVHPSAVNAKDHVTLACQGNRCKPLQCRWQDAAGFHQLSFAGGIGADYTDPGGRSRRLALERSDACENCRARYLNLYWADPARPEVGTLSLLWSGLEFDRGGEGHMGGFASWSNQQPALMSCTAR
jgi:hypothetical protein